MLTRLQQFGFTLLEVIMVLALLTIVAVLLLSGFRDYMAYQQFTQSVRDIQLTIQESQTAARLSVGGTAHGVKIVGSTVTKFAGDTYSISDPTNVDRVFPNVSLSPSLTDSGDEIVFSSLSGYPDETGTITITGSTYDGSIALQVSAGGVVQY